MQGQLLQCPPGGRQLCERAALVAGIHKCDRAARAGSGTGFGSGSTELRELPAGQGEGEAQRGAAHVLLREAQAKKLQAEQGARSCDCSSRSGCSMHIRMRIGGHSGCSAYAAVACAHMYVAVACTYICG